MNLRFVTLASPLAILFALAAPARGEDQPGLSIVLPQDAGAPAGAIPAPTSEDTSGEPARAGLLRGPGWFRAPAAANPVPPTASIESAELPATPETEPNAARTNPPPRTWLQRLRDRRISQLERQVQRLRESQQESQQASAAESAPADGVRVPPAPLFRRSTPAAEPDGLDLEIDLGQPLDVQLNQPANPAPQGPSGAARQPASSDSAPSPPNNLGIALPPLSPPSAPLPALQMRFLNE